MRRRHSRGAPRPRPSDRKNGRQARLCAHARCFRKGRRQISTEARSTRSRLRSAALRMSVNIAVGSVGHGSARQTATHLSPPRIRMGEPDQSSAVEFLSLIAIGSFGYDSRGVGLPIGTWSNLARRILNADLEVTVDCLQLDRYALLGISQGVMTAVAHAVRHPERVSKLVLHGGKARGAKRRSSPKDAEMSDALVALMRRGWGDENSPYMRMFVSRYAGGIR